MRKVFSFSLLMVAAFFLKSCDKITDCCAPPFPEPFCFVLVEANGEALIKTEEDTVEVFYFENDRRKKIDDCTTRQNPCPKNIRTFPEESIYPVLFVSSKMNSLSRDSNIKEFYLEMNNDVDTIYVDVPKGRNTVSKVIFNGVEMQQDRDVMPWVYVLKK